MYSHYRYGRAADIIGLQYRTKKTEFGVAVPPLTAKLLFLI